MWKLMGAAAAGLIGLTVAGAALACADSACFRIRIRPSLAPRTHFAGNGAMPFKRH